jgi:hypothetical protein
MTRRWFPRKRFIPLQERFDWGLVLAFVLALVAATPFLTRPGLPRGTDAELHVFRAAELGYSLRAGDIYPRWAPDFYYGYGYPIFNYYAPLAYYLANLFNLSPGIDIVGGVKMVFVLGLVCASVGMYLLVRDWMGPRAGLLAAALYVFAPYVLFVDPHMRGVLAESFSLGLFPLTLWAFSRVLVDSRRRWVLAGAMFLAALIMTHNLLAVVSVAILLAYLAWELGGDLIRLRRRAMTAATLRQWWRRFGRVLLALGLGIGLSAIFWLPVALERNEVQLNLTGPGHFDFHNHFVSPRELFGPSPILDLGATAPRYGLNLGLPQWPLALLALLAVAWGRSRARRLAGFFLLCSLSLVTLMLVFSTPLWENVPGMAFLQFPWRLLGPAAAALSVAAATGYATLTRIWPAKGGTVRRERWGVVLLTVGVGLTLFLALPTMFPPLWGSDFGATDPAAMIEFELTGIAVGTTSTGDYLPTTVEIQPRPEPALLGSYRAPDRVDRVNRATLPSGTVVTPTSDGPTLHRFQVVSEKPFILRLFLFHFPGWRATVDGKEVSIELGRPEGFITVPVPAGTHMVEVRMRALGTPARALGALVTLLSVAALFVFVWWRRPSVPSPTSLPQSHRGRQRHRTAVKLDKTAGAAVGVLLLIFLVLKVGLVDRQHDWFRHTSPPGQVLKAQYSLVDEGIHFGQYIQLLGYDLPDADVRSGDELPLTLYWRAIAPVPDNLQVFAHLTRPVAHLWGQSDNLNPGAVPTSRWPLEKYVRDEHTLGILPGTPPGEYQLSVGLYTMADAARVPVFDGEGTALGDTFVLPSPVSVTPPRRPPDEDELRMTDVLATKYGDRVTLLGAAVPDRRVELPGFVHLTLFWRAEQPRPEDITVRLQLLDSDGSVVDEIVTAPVNGRYPSSKWSAGEVVRDPYSFWLGQDALPGTYQLQVGVKEGGIWESLGTFKAVGQ